MDTNMSYLSELKRYKKIIIIKSMLRKLSVEVHGTYNQFWVLDIKNHNDQAPTDFESDLSFSAEELKKCALSARAERYISY